MARVYVAHKLTSANRARPGLREALRRRVVVQAGDHRRLTLTHQVAARGALLGPGGCGAVQLEGRRQVLEGEVATELAGAVLAGEKPLDPHRILSAAGLRPGDWDNVLVGVLTVG